MLDKIKTLEQRLENIDSNSRREEFKSNNFNESKSYPLQNRPPKSPNAHRQNPMTPQSNVNDVTQRSNGIGAFTSDFGRSQ